MKTSLHLNYHLMLYILMKEETRILCCCFLLKNVLFFRKGSNLLWCLRERRKRIQPVIWNHNFSWPYHATLSSRPHLALLLLHGRGVLNRRLVEGCFVLLQDFTTSLPTKRTQSFLTKGLLSSLVTTVLYLPTHPRCKLTLTQDSLWLKLLREHLQISFHYSHTFPINHITASVNFQMCVLYRDSLIDGLVKGQ